jgi:hypothetical protein
MYRVFAKLKLVRDARKELKNSLRNLYRKKAATAAPRPANAGTWIIWAAPVACSAELEVGEAPELAADSESEVVAVADLEATEVTVERDAVTEALSADTDAAAVALGSESSPSVMVRGIMLKYPSGNTVEVWRAASAPSGQRSE